MDNAFVKAILANPQDCAPRLVYADYLEERGQAKAGARQRHYSALMSKVITWHKGRGWFQIKNGKYKYIQIDTDGSLKESAVVYDQPFWILRDELISALREHSFSLLSNIGSNPCAEIPLMEFK